LAPPEFGLVDLQQRGEPFMDLIKQFDWASHFDVSFFPGDCATWSTKMMPEITGPREMATSKGSLAGGL
jgi:hypothetical protein